MNEALQNWRADFTHDPGTAFDRLMRGVVPLGGASQLSIGEILDALFEPGDAALDAVAAGWLEGRILGPLPANTSVHRWASILTEFFRGIAPMELSKTGEVLRLQHKRLRLWLHGFYEGPDRDPEGAYLLALTRAQDSQHFSPLWRRLILSEEFAGRPYLGIGILGFRKMPSQGGQQSSGVPDGLLQALIELGDKPGTGQARWKQTIRSLFATYRRSEGFWVEHLAPLLPRHEQPSNAREWLTSLLPGIRGWRPQQATTSHPGASGIRMVPVAASKEWAGRLLLKPSLSDTIEFKAFLSQHRAYAENSGDTAQINIFFNRAAKNLITADLGHAAFAVSLMVEALHWAPEDPHNWTVYSQALRAADRTEDAISALWEARHRFPFNPFIRTELGGVLRASGDLKASEGVLREAVGHFPGNVFCRTVLAEILREMERLDDARNVLEQACQEFPSNLVCQAALADLLIDLGEVGEAERIYREVLTQDRDDRSARGGLARSLSILSAQRGNVALRDEARSILEQLTSEGDWIAQSSLRVFDDQWQRATTDSSIRFRRKTKGPRLQFELSHIGHGIAEMNAPERLGRAMVALWQAERQEDVAQRASLCSSADALLDLPDERIGGDLLAAFVETRGLVLLARGDTRGALAYFERQVHYYGRGQWTGIRLGELRARILLGEVAGDTDTGEPPISQSARFALHVAKVIQALSRDSPESELRELLKELYPRAAAFAARAQSGTEGDLLIKSGAQMLGAFMEIRWFKPAGIETSQDFDQANKFQAVVHQISTSRTDAFEVLSNATSELAHAA